MDDNKRNKLYFYAENGRQIGPLGFRELMSANISEETLVWYAGLAEWVPAGELPELSPLFCKMPPPLPDTSSGKSSMNWWKNLWRRVIKRRKVANVVVAVFSAVVIISLLFIIYTLRKDKQNPPMPDNQSTVADSAFVDMPVMLNTATARPVVSLHAATKVNSTSAVISAGIIQGTSSISSETVEYAVKGTRKYWKQVLVREKGRGVGYLGNLKPETTYKYRVRVKSKAGTVLTDWETFTTLPSAVDITYVLSEHNRTIFDWLKACNISGKNRNLVEACDYTNNIVRNRAVHIAGSTPGSFNIGQVCDLFDYCINNWRYVNDAQKGESIELASNTLKNGLNGDCDDFAVLMASMIMAVGGEARISYVYKENHGHAFAEVNIGATDIVAVERYVSKRYARIYKGNTWYRTDDSGNHWLNLDWWERHPGGRYYESDRGIRFYLIQHYCEEF